MKELVKSLYRNYGIYSNIRNLPSIVDGLKPVERRVLLSAHEISRKKFIKSARVDGHVIGNYHPHGSCYGTIVQLVQKGFLEGQGNFGHRYGLKAKEPAQMRYTEVRINDFIEELMFSKIEFSERIKNDLGIIEPLYLTPLFPLCLVGNIITQGIGFGYRCVIPSYKIDDLYKRLLWLLGERKTEPIIYPITECNIVSGKKKIKTILKEGRGHIKVEGIFEEYPDQNIFVIKSFPPLRSGKTYIMNLKEEFNKGILGYLDASKEKTSVIIEVTRVKGSKDIFKETTEKLKNILKGKIYFEINLIDEKGNVIETNVDDMLVSTFLRYISFNEKYVKREIEDLKKLLVENVILIGMKKNMNIIDIKKPIDEIVEFIFSQILKKKIDKDIINKTLRKYNINRLFDEIKEEVVIGDIRNSIGEKNKKLERIKEETIEEYGKLVEKIGGNL